MTDLHSKREGEGEKEKKRKITPARIFALTRQISLSEVSVGFSDIMPDYRRAVPSLPTPPSKFRGSPPSSRGLLCIARPFFNASPFSDL